MRHSVTQDFNNNTSTPKSTNEANGTIGIDENSEVIGTGEPTEAMTATQETSSITTYSTRDDYNNVPQIETSTVNESSADAIIMHAIQRTNSNSSFFSSPSTSSPIFSDESDYEDEEEDDASFDYDDSLELGEVLQFEEYTSVDMHQEIELTKRRSLIEKIPPHRPFLNAVKVAWNFQVREAFRENQLQALQEQQEKQKREEEYQKQLPFKNPYPPSKLTFDPAPDPIAAAFQQQKHVDIPPITASSLRELSVSQLFNCLQVRHDLLMDPNLSFRPNFTYEKSRYAEKYWYRLKKAWKEHELKTPRIIRAIDRLVTELASILCTLISPFPRRPAASVVWNWPSHIGEKEIHAVLDPELILQEIVQDCFNIVTKFDFVLSIISPLCPSEGEKIQALVDTHDYVEAMEAVFATLETIKLDVANKAIRYYRPYLIGTGTELEWKLFLKQVDSGEVDTSSVTEWLLQTWNRIGFQERFDDVYYMACINLITDDEETTDAFGLPATEFPITFRYDERRINTLLRHEFQNIIVIALLLMPYRLMAGRFAHESHVDYLKDTISRRLQDAASVYHGRVSCHELAMLACQTAAKVRPIGEDMETLSNYWSNWMHQNLRNSSPVYKVMYDRIRTKLFEGLRKGEMPSVRSHALVAMEEDIVKLGEKVIKMVGYNRRIYHPLYRSVALSVHNNVESFT